jgi:hypothetical protein
VERISSILGKGVAEQLFYASSSNRRAAESEVDADATPSGPEQSTLSHFGD